jgi:hypothetical protein
MLRRRRTRQTISTRPQRLYDGFHEWVLSLPWVVERPYSLATPGVRSYGVDCEPLGRRQLWLLTGLGETSDQGARGLAVIVPADAARVIKAAAWGRAVAPMPGEHLLVSVHRNAIDRIVDVEALVLTAYGCAMS